MLLVVFATGSSLGGFPLGGNTTSPPAPRPRQVRSWCSTLRFCRKTVPKPAPIAKKYRSYGRRAQILRLHAGRILCGRRTGLRYWSGGKPAVRRARHREGGARLKATRFRGGPISRRSGTMERRAQLTASLRRSEAVVRRHFAGRMLAAFKDESRATPSHHSFAVRNERFTTRAAIPRSQQRFLAPIMVSGVSSLRRPCNL